MQDRKPSVLRPISANCCRVEGSVQCTPMVALDGLNRLLSGNSRYINQCMSCSMYQSLCAHCMLTVANGPCTYSELCLKSVHILLAIPCRLSCILAMLSCTALFQECYVCVLRWAVKEQITKLADSDLINELNRHPVEHNNSQRKA